MWLLIIACDAGTDPRVTFSFISIIFFNLNMETNSLKIESNLSLRIWNGRVKQIFVWFETYERPRKGSNVIWHFGSPFPICHLMTQSRTPSPLNCHELDDIYGTKRRQKVWFLLLAKFDLDSHKPCFECWQNLTFFNIKSSL